MFSTRTSFDWIVRSRTHAPRRPVIFMGSTRSVNFSNGSDRFFSQNWFFTWIKSLKHGVNLCCYHVLMVKILIHYGLISHTSCKQPLRLDILGRHLWKIQQYFNRTLTQLLYDMVTLVDQTTKPTKISKHCIYDMETIVN